MKNKIHPDVAVYGVVADAPLANRAGCLSIALMYPKEFSERLSDFSRRVSEVSPSIIYHPEDVHTTVVKCCNVKKDFYFHPSREEDGNPFGILIDSLCEVWNKFEKVSVVMESCWYFCLRSAIVLVQKPNPNFFLLIKNLQESCIKQGLSVSSPTVIEGTVVTTLGRFTREIPPEKLKDLFNLFDRFYPPKESGIDCVSIGYSSWTPLSAEENCSGKLHGHYVPRLSIKV